MSFTKSITVWCDHEDCCDWIGQEPTEELAHKKAIKNGWKFVLEDYAHYCPRHQDSEDDEELSSEMKKVIEERLEELKKGNVISTKELKERLFKKRGG